MGHRFKTPEPRRPQRNAVGDANRRSRAPAEPGSPSEARDIVDQITDSEGKRVSWKMGALRDTFFVFAGNDRQLRNAIRAFENAENCSKLWNVDNREVLGQFQREIMRLLHNFLASATTLIDHTRIVTGELYEKRPFLEEYRRETADVFSQSAITGFVKGLRNWMLHKGLVPVVVRLSDTGPNGALVSSVVLDLREMKSWDKWDLRAKAFLAEATSDPLLCDVVESYAVLVLRFYRWLEKRMVELTRVQIGCLTAFRPLKTWA